MTSAGGPAANFEPLRISLYRPQNQLGDLLLNVPAIRAIRERFPRAHVTLVVGPQNAAAVLGQPWANEVRVLDARGFLGALRAAVPRGPRPDLAVYFTTVSYSKGGALSVRASRARERLGFDPARYGMKDMAGLTRAIPYPTETLHQSELCWALAAAVGSGPPPPPPHFIPDPALAGVAPAGVTYVHPGAGKPKNRWRADRFAAVVRELLGRGREVLWIEGPQDGGCVDAATQALGRSLPTVRGESIAHLAARFSKADLYLGNDTGPLHLAGAVGCPTVGLYGWSNPAEWAPVGRLVRSVRAADHSLDSITPTDVLDTALPLLTEERCATA
jgi:ADP-heptose:LPS heptosyltransferase